MIIHQREKTRDSRGQWYFYRRRWFDLRQNLRHRESGVVKSVPVQDFNLLDRLLPSLACQSVFNLCVKWNSTTSCQTEEIFPLFSPFI